MGRFKVELEAVFELWASSLDKHKLASPGFLLIKNVKFKSAKSFSENWVHQASNPRAYLLRAKNTGLGLRARVQTRSTSRLVHSSTKLDILALRVFWQNELKNADRVRMRAKSFAAKVESRAETSLDFRSLELFSYRALIRMIGKLFWACWVLIFAFFSQAWFSVITI